MINWPGILKYNNDPELIYIKNQAQWDSNEDFYHGNFDDSDFLIDALGNVFCLVKKLNTSVIPKLNGKAKTLHEILGLVKNHASHLDSCCVSKLYAPSILEAYNLVKLINEQDS